jgi:hypothetical protein
MRDLTPGAVAWLAGHHGVITTPALRANGVGRSTTERLVRAEVLRCPHKGVYVLAATTTTLLQRCVVVCAAHPAGFITSVTAGTIIGARRMPFVSGIRFAVRHGVNLPSELGVVLRQTTALSPRHIHHRDDGIAIASPARFCFDVTRDLPSLDHLSVLHQMVDQGRVTIDELVAIGDELCHPARRGSTRFRESLARLGSGAAAQSHGEVQLAEALRERGVPVECQSKVDRGNRGKGARIDLAVPEVRWGVELDVHPEHRSLEGHGGDAQRYRDLHLVDWQIEPVSEADLADVNSLADELAGLYQARRRQVSARPSA